VEVVGQGDEVDRLVKVHRPGSGEVPHAAQTSFLAFANQSTKRSTPLFTENQVPTLKAASPTECDAVLLDFLVKGVTAFLISGGAAVVCWRPCGSCIRIFTPMP
jgi:hypothetical protein